jgi:hypothetical protein
MKFRLIFQLILILFMTSYAYTQVYDYGFEKKFNIVVKDSLGSDLKMPWVGGMNSMQFSEIDLNMDGIVDLFAFDKVSNKVLTFVNKGIPDSISYVYDYSYEKYFPAFYGWAHLVDYNNDGKVDIFAYSTLGGIMAYKNISDTILKFKLVSSLIYSEMGGSSSNIYVTSDDYPAIYDIDGDGDQDILAFYILGTWITYQRNMSQELYGNSDTLLYKLTTECWGKVAESSSNNQIYLDDTTCSGKSGSVPTAKPTRHVGSTLLAGNFNGDSLTDLLVGDVEYFNITALYNGSTHDSIITKDTLFPYNSKPIHFNSFPVLNLVDVNNDRLKDLLASPFTSIINIPENNNSVWYYKNTGDSITPQFTYVGSNFLQKDMIDFGSGAYPVIYDVNTDGLPDIMVGNFGYLDSSYYESGSLKSKIRSQIAVLQNTGTLSNPSFHLATKDYANISQYKLTGLIPTFGDTDGDGDMDMICGQSNGSLIYFENTAGAGNSPVYAAPDFNYKGIDVGDNSAPQLFDLNSDNLPDLIVGKKKGYLTFYQNTGTVSNPVFTKITDTLGRVHVIDTTFSYDGYSTPCFFKDSGVIKLFVGSDNGHIYYYKDIAANLAGKFTAIDSILVYTDKDSATLIIKDGIRRGVAAADLNHDGYMDMVVGNFSGGLTYYNGIKPNGHVGIAENETDATVNFNIYPNPVSGKLYINVANSNQMHFKVEIYDLIGQKILEKDFNNTAHSEIDMQYYRAGFYICRLLTIDKQGESNQAGTKKFIVSW